MDRINKSLTAFRFELQLCDDRVVTAVEKAAVYGERPQLGVEVQFRLVVLFVTLSTERSTLQLNTVTRERKKDGLVRRYKFCRLKTHFYIHTRTSPIWNCEPLRPAAVLPSVDSTFSAVRSGSPSPETPLSGNLS